MSKEKINDLGMSYDELDRALVEYGYELTEADDELLYKNILKILRKLSFDRPDDLVGVSFFSEAWVLFALMGKFEEALSSLSVAHPSHYNRAVYRLCVYCIMSGKIDAAKRALEKLESNKDFHQLKLQEGGSIADYAFLSGSAEIVEVASLQDIDAPDAYKQASYSILSGELDFALRFLRSVKNDFKADDLSGFLVPAVLTGENDIVVSIAGVILPNEACLLEGVLARPEFFEYAVLSRSVDMVERSVRYGLNPNTYMDHMSYNLILSSTRSILELLFKRMPTMRYADKINSAIEHINKLIDENPKNCDVVRFASQKVNMLETSLKLFPASMKGLSLVRANLETLRLRILCRTSLSSELISINFLEKVINSAIAAATLRQKIHSSLFSPPESSAFLKKLDACIKNYAGDGEVGLLNELCKIVSAQRIIQLNTFSVDSMIYHCFNSLLRVMWPKAHCFEETKVDDLSADDLPTTAPTAACTT